MNGSTAGELQSTEAGAATPRQISRAVVLGGAGFLGEWLVDSLLADGVTTTIVDDLSTGDAARAGDGTLVVADVIHDDLVPIVEASQPDVVFHLASAAYVPPSFDDPVLDLARNTGSTLALLQAVRKVKQPPLVVLVSSAAVYGDSRSLPMDEDHPLNPVSPYGISKWAAEQYLRLYHELFGIRGLIARPFSLYVPGQRKQVVYDLLTRCLSDDATLAVLGTPEVTRDLVFVADAARALSTLARTAPARAEAYNLASGIPTSLGELSAKLVSAAGVDKLVRFSGSVRPGDPIRWEGDPRRAAALGARCDTPLDIGLKLTASWIRSGCPTRSIALPDD
jgi:UDP-glucose 4-epimerase